jgi:hypothetical protein
MAVDRKFRRLRKQLRDRGAGMALRQVPTPGISDANQMAYFETLYDGARGRERGVWQHKPLKIDEK